MLAEFDGCEARFYCQPCNLGLRSDVIDLGWKSCLESRIFCRTKPKGEETAWFHYAAGFGEMVERRFPEVDRMDSENLVERLVRERQLVAAAEAELYSFVGQQPPMSTRRDTIHDRRKVYSAKQTARDVLRSLCQSVAM